MLSILLFSVRILESTEELYEPLVTPLGSWSIIEPLKTVVPSKVLNTEPLTMLLPSIICELPLTTPLGKELITWVEPLIVPAGTEPPPPLGNVIELPLDIVSSLPSIESVCESVSDVR